MGAKKDKKEQIGKKYYNITDAIDLICGIFFCILESLPMSKI